LRAAGRSQRLPTWAQKLTAFLLGLAPFVMLEAALWGIDYGGRSHVVLASETPVFEEVDGTVTVKPSFRWQFRTRPFQLDKGPDTKRVIVVGDSVAHGIGLSRDDRSRAFPALLEGSLSADHPAQHIEVLNCGGLGHASFHAKHVTRQVLTYSPDLIVIAMGSSEWLERCLLKNWTAITDSLAITRYSKTVLLARSLARRLSIIAAPSDVYQFERYAQVGFRILPLLEEDLVLTERDIESLLAGSRENLEAIVEMCRTAGIPLILATEACNLRMEPNLEILSRRASEGGRAPAADVAPTDFSSPPPLRTLKAEAAELETASTPQQRQRLAATYYMMGMQYEAAEDFEKAREHYGLAKDHELLPTRPLSPFNDLLRELTEQPHVYLADVETAFWRSTPGGVPGWEIFLDDVHPAVAGHELYATEIHRVIFEHALLRDAN